MKAAQPLPAELKFLQAFVNRLARLSPESLASDHLDLSPLEAAYRKRVRGMNVREAEQRLDEDRQTLATWLETSASSDHPAYYVLGVLMSRGLARDLLAPPENPAPVPTIRFDPPTGWTTRLEVKSGSLNCRKGRLYAGISAVDKDVFEDTLAFGIWPAEESEVQLGDVTGKKFLRQGTDPFVKQIDYCLAVPGGFVMIMLTNTVVGRDFDEAPFEAQLHTLRVSEPV